MILSNLAVGVLIVSSIAYLLTRDWRWNILSIMGVYLGTFLLVTQHWPMVMALVKLIVGWMSSVALGLTRIGISASDTSEASWPSSRVFRLFAAGLVFLVVSMVAPSILPWFSGMTIFQAWGGLCLIGIGLLSLGMTGSPFRIVLGLLMFLAGFEIIYAAVEASLLVAGLLAGVNLGLALLGVYLIYPRSQEDNG